MRALARRRRRASISVHHGWLQPKQSIHPIGFTQRSYVFILLERALLQHPMGMPANSQLKLSSSQPDLELIERLSAIQAICLSVVAIIAATIFCGWLVRGLGAWLPDGWSLMKVNTASCMLLGCGSLALSRTKRSEWQLWLSRVLAIVLVVLAGSALFEHVTGRITGLDTLLASDAASDMPGRMSLQTAAYLSLLGLSLVFARARKSALSTVVDALTMGFVALTLVILAGYCFGAARLFGQSTHTLTSPQTLLSMVVLAFVAVGRRAEYGYFSVFVGMGIGSRIARAVLLFALLLPFLLVLGGAYTTLVGWLSEPYAAALIAAVTSIVLFATVAVMAWRINDLERDLREMSLTDELTGVLNQRGFSLLGEQALRESRRSSSALTVLFFDLDGLKHVNDSLGHDVGSQFVRDVAALLSTNFRGADIVARVGGDEFAVITASDSASTQIALARIFEAAETINSSGEGKRYLISFSVGEASSDVFGSESFAELVARADAMMYEQKHAKKISTKR